MIPPAAPGPSLRSGRRIRLFESPSVRLRRVVCPDQNVFRARFGIGGEESGVGGLRPRLAGTAVDTPSRPRPLTPFGETPVVPATIAVNIRLSPSSDRQTCTDGAETEPLCNPLGGCVRSAGAVKEDSSSIRWKRCPSGSRRGREAAASELRHSGHAHLGTCRSEPGRDGDGHDLSIIERDAPRRPELADIHEPQRRKVPWHPPPAQTSKQAVARNRIRAHQLRRFLIVKMVRKSPDPPHIVPLDWRFCGQEPEVVVDVDRRAVVVAEGRLARGQAIERTSGPSTYILAHPCHIA